MREKTMSATVRLSEIDDDAVAFIHRTIDEAIERNISVSVALSAGVRPQPAPQFPKIAKPKFPGDRAV